MTRREFAIAVAAAQAPPEVRCRVLDHRGEPLAVEELRRFHLCDLLLRSIPVQPQFAPGEVRFRHHIHAWDVINEAHLQNALGFSIEQQLDMTRAACQAVRQADPSCFPVVNCCCTWSDYVARGAKPGQQSVYDYVKMVRDAGIDFEALGLQYYCSGRDLLEIDRNIETFKDFGKPIHITELGLPSASQEGPNQHGQTTRYPWHGERWSETAQADWVEQFYTIAYSKPYIEAITWWDLSEPAFIPQGGLLREDLTPKESYLRLSTLLARWRQMGS